MVADISCETDPNTVADMSRFTSGAAPIHCHPWEIGTGVTGYVWHAPALRAVLLILHGWSEHAQRYVQQYDQLVPHLLNAGVSVHAFDVWGHGHSQGRRGLVDVRQAVNDHLAATQTGGRPLAVFVLGHSLGGLVTATRVVHDQGGLNDVVLPYHGAEEDERLANDPLLHRGRLPVLVAAGGGTVSNDNWSRYPDRRVPVLIIHGTADRATNPEGSWRLFNTITAEDKTLHLVEGGYHELLNDTMRNETPQVLLTWLERRIPTRAGSGTGVS